MNPATIAIIHQVQQLRLDVAVNDPASGEAGAMSTHHP
jgi:hypothetical protein